MIDSLQSQRWGAVAAILATIDKFGTGRISSAFDGWMIVLSREPLLQNWTIMVFMATKCIQRLCTVITLHPKCQHPWNVWWNNKHWSHTEDSGLLYPASAHARIKLKMDKDRHEFPPISTNFASRLSLCLDKDCLYAKLDELDKDLKNSRTYSVDKQLTSKWIQIVET